MHPVADYEIEVSQPFDFRLTVAKPAGWNWSTPREVFEAGTIWAGFRVRGRTAGIKAFSPDNRVVRATAYASSGLTSEEEEELRVCLACGLGADEDIEGFYRFASRDRILRRAVADRYGMHVGRVDQLFGRVILAQLLQMAPFKRSLRMIEDLLDAYGKTIEFDGRRVTLWPSATAIAGLDPGVLQARVNIGYRARHLHAAAEYLVRHPISMRDLDGLPDSEALSAVQRIPGIGPYSAGIVLGRVAPIDSWSVIVMSELLTGETPRRPRQEIERVADRVRRRWKKWSWFAFVYVLNDLDNLAAEYNLTRLT